MNDLSLQPDDPRITAYALGELEGEERSAVEAALRQNPALRTAVAEIRATAAQLAAALAAEPDAESAAGAAVNSPMHASAAPVVDEYRQPKRGPVGKLLQFPQIYYIVGGAAAACFAVIAVLQGPPPPPPVVAKVSEPATVQIPITFAPRENTEPAPALTVSVALSESATTPPTAPATPGEALASTPVRTDDGSVPAPTPTTPALPRSLAATDPAHAPVDPVKSVAEEKKEEIAAGATPAAVVVALDNSPPRAPVAPPETGTGTRESLATPSAVELRPGNPAGTGGGRVTITIHPSVNLPSLDPKKNGNDVPRGATSPSVATTSTVPVSSGTRIAVGPGATPTREPAPTPKQPDPRMAGADDIVRLEAFQVATERSSSYGALGSSTATRSFAGKKLPAPRGARFHAKGARRESPLENGFLPVEENPRSSFPADVDNASYATVRRAIEAGALPARDAVKIEELVNYFPYRYTAPQGRDDHPIAAALEVTEAPWAPKHRLVRIGLKGREPAAVDRLSAIARDVKIEVVFNAAKVSSYRLIGFEGPRLNPEDYDRSEGVDLAAGHMMTALYEVIPVGVEERHVADKPALDSARFQREVVVSSRLETPSQEDVLTNEMLVVKVGYKRPEGLTAAFTRNANFKLTDTGARFANASADFKFAASVAEFGMILRQSPHRGEATIGDVLAWASAGAASNADDPRGYRGEFIGLVRKAQALLR